LHAVLKANVGQNENLNCGISGEAIAGGTLKEQILRKRLTHISNLTMTGCKDWIKQQKWKFLLLPNLD